MEVEGFLRSMMRDVAWGFFYGWVNFDEVFGTVNHYGEVDVFMGAYNQAYKNSGSDFTERFDSKTLHDCFKSLLSDWTNAGFDPFAAPLETGSAHGPKNGNNDEAVNFQREVAQRFVGLPGDSPIRSDENGQPVNRHFADVEQSGTRGACRGGIRRPAGGVQPVQVLVPFAGHLEPLHRFRGEKQRLLPHLGGAHPAGGHGNDRVEWFIQLSDEITWKVGSKDTAAPMSVVTMKAGDVACMPADIRHRGFAPKRSMLLVWGEHDAGAGEALRTGRVAAGAGLVLTCRPKFTPSGPKTSAISCSSTGASSDAADGGVIEVLNPHDNSKITDLAAAGPADVDRAAAAARDAFHDWSNAFASEARTPYYEAGGQAGRAWRRAGGTGKPGHRPPLAGHAPADLPRTLLNFRYFGGLADKIDGRQAPVEPGFLSLVKRQPVGVVGQIVPWNFPIMFCSWKLGPALAAGNTVVMKTLGALTPLTTLRLAELMNEVGFPPGVVNIVPGYGHSAGARIAEHPDIDKVAFTGSTETGRKIVTASAGNLKRLSLEMGGKGPNIVFEDAICRRPSAAAPSPYFTTRDRPASPARDCCCTRPSPMSFWRSSSAWRNPYA